MGNLTGGLISGLIFGAVVVATMLPMQFPDKATSLLAAFIKAYAPILIIGCNRRLGLLTIFVGFGLAGCGGGHLHKTSPFETRTTPPYLEMRSEVSAATLHFPRGIYVLDQTDDNGYYYRAPRKITQRSWSGGLPHDGGIFVSKRDRRKLRGYVILPGGLTHVGNFSSSDHEFRY